jgi:putative hemolysin
MTEKQQPLKCQCGGTINVRDSQGRWVVCPLPRGKRCDGNPKAREPEPWD